MASRKIGNREKINEKNQRPKLVTGELILEGFTKIPQRVSMIISLELSITSCNVHKKGKAISDPTFAFPDNSMERISNV